MTNERSRASLPARSSRGQMEFKVTNWWHFRVFMTHEKYTGMREVEQLHLKKRTKVKDADHEVAKVCGC